MAQVRKKRNRVIRSLAELLVELNQQKYTSIASSLTGALTGLLNCNPMDSVECFEDALRRDLRPLPEEKQKR